jgi:hypothetical protein
VNGNPWTTPTIPSLFIPGLDKQSILDPDLYEFQIIITEIRLFAGEDNAINFRLQGKKWTEIYSRVTHE